MSPFTTSPIDQAAVSLWEDDPYGAVISDIPSVIVCIEQVIFPGLSLLCTSCLLIAEPQLISTAQCFMVSVSAVVDNPVFQSTALSAICLARASASNVNYCTLGSSSNLKLIDSTESCHSV